jgi:hypothetical protein
MILSLLDAFIEVVGFPSGVRKAVGPKVRWLLIVCVSATLLALALGAMGAFLTFYRVTHNHQTSLVAAMLAWFVLLSMTRIVVTGTLIPLHYPEPGEAPSDQPAWLWRDLFGRLPESSRDYRPPVQPTVLLSMITVLAAHPVVPWIVQRLFSNHGPKYIETLLNIVLFVTVVACFGVRHALYAKLYPYLIEIWRDEVSLIKRDLAWREFRIERFYSAYGDALVESKDQPSVTDITKHLEIAMKRRSQLRRLGVKANARDGSRWTDLFEHWIELRYRYAAPAAVVDIQGRVPQASIKDDGERVRAVVP